MTTPYFIARVKVELDEDILADRRSQGVRDSAIIHEICDELQGYDVRRLTDLGQPEFSGCVIKEE